MRRAVLLTTIALTVVGPMVYLRGRSFSDRLSYESRTSGLHFAIASVRGRIELEKCTEPRPYAFYGFGWHVTTERLDPDQVYPVPEYDTTWIGVVAVTRSVRSHVDPTRQWSGGMAPMVRAPYTRVAVPVWLLLLLVVPLPLAELARGIRRYRRIQAGRCASCGYDLRGGNGRCPECGKATGDERANS